MYTLHLPLCLLRVSYVSHTPTQLRLSPQQNQNPGRKHNIQGTVKDELLFKKKSL